MQCEAEEIGEHKKRKKFADQPKLIRKTREEENPVLKTNSTKLEG
jgi:hypothetical protein